MVHGGFTSYIRNTYFKDSLKGYCGKLNLIYIGRSEKETRKYFELVLGYETKSQGLTFLWFKKTETSW